MTDFINSLRGLDGTTASGRFAIFPPQGESDQASLDELREAIVISLHTDRRADASELPHGVRNRGWWGSTYETGDALGSLLWAVMARGMTTASAAAYADAARAALKWLTDDGVADKVDVTAERVNGGVQLTTIIHRGNAEPYSYVWEAYRGQ